jgi:hypothetical protein
MGGPLLLLPELVERVPVLLVHGDLRDAPVVDLEVERVDLVELAGSDRRRDAFRGRRSSSPLARMNRFSGRRPWPRIFGSRARNSHDTTGRSRYDFG